MLPTSRNETATPDGPVLSETMNDLQDSVIAGGHGDRVVCLSPYTGYVSDVSPGITTGGGPGVLISTGAAIVYVPLPSDIGSRIKAVKFWRFGDGAADITNVIITRFNAGTVTAIASSGAINNTPASWNTTTITVGSPIAAVDGDSYFLEMVIAAANIKIGTIEVTLDRPL